MTCIVGMVDGRDVWLGGDSMERAGCQRCPDAVKLIRRGDMLLGTSGTARLGQILLHHLEIPAHPDGMPSNVYLIKSLVPALRAAITENDGVKIDDSDSGWQILLGYRGELYEMVNDLYIAPLPEYGAIGCGHMPALGALHAMWPAREDVAPREMLMRALAAAAKHDIHVAPPFVIERLAG